MPKIPDPEALAGSRPSLAPSGSVTAAKPSANIPRMDAGVEGAQALAKGLASVSDAAATVFLREEERTNTLRAEDALNKLKTDKLELTFDKDQGFTQQTGENALNKPLIKDWTTKFNERVTQIGETLDNSRQREMFQHRANIELGSFQADVYRHVAIERDRYSQAVLKSTIDTEVKNVGANPADDVEFKRSVERVNYAHDQEGDRLGYVGKKKLLTENEKAKSLDLLWTARLDAWRLQDPKEAMRAYQDNALQISPVARARIEEGLFRDSAPVLAAGLNAAGGPPVPANALVSATRDDLRPDGTRKGQGFFGPLQLSGGNVATEYSVGVEVNGKQMDVPSLVPTLTPAEVEEVKKAAAENRFPSDAVIEKARAHAEQRVKEGKPVFAQPGEQGRFEGGKYVPLQDAPRGIRNNNPGNIIQGPTKWEGQIDGSDPKYASFAVPEAGIRAMVKNISTYGNQGIDSVQAIIGRWAPATENATDEYISTVAKKMGVNPAEPLNLRDRKVMTSLVTAMIEHENGKNPYSDETVGAGVDSGLSGKQFAYEATRSPAYSMASLSNMTPADMLNYKTGDPVIDRLPLDQKLRVFQLAREQSHQGMSQIQNATKQRLLDATAAYEAGKDAPAAPSRDELISVFGQLDGERYHGDLQLSKQFGQDVQAVQSLPMTNQAALIAARAPVPGPGFAVAQQRYEMLTRAVDQVNKQREQDPARAIMQSSPQVAAAYQKFATERGSGTESTASAQAYAAATLAEQQRLEVRNPQILTKDMVDGIARQFAAPLAPGENLANVMRGMTDTWGKYWPLVGNQIKDKLPPEAVVIGLGVSAEAEMALSDVAKQKREAITQGIPNDQQTLTSELVTKQMEPFKNTMLDQRGGVYTYDNYADAANKLALGLVQKGVKPKEAAQKAVESLLGFKYEVEGTWRVPKIQLGGDTTMSALRWGSDALKTDIASDKPVVGERQALMVPMHGAAVRPKDAEAQWRRDVAAKAFWVTTPGDGGLTLYMPSGLSSEPVMDGFGKPVTRTWQQISEMGNSVRAAHFSDLPKRRP